jgi:hypothetical protein
LAPNWQPNSHSVHIRQSLPAGLTDPLPLDRFIWIEHLTADPRCGLMKNVALGELGLCWHRANSKRPRHTIVVRIESEAVDRPGPTRIVEDHRIRADMNVGIDQRPSAHSAGYYRCDSGKKRTSYSPRDCGRRGYCQNNRFVSLTAEEQRIYWPSQ